jgi:hypothetical protein
MDWTMVSDGDVLKLIGHDGRVASAIPICGGMRLLGGFLVDGDVVAIKIVSRKKPS